MTHRRLVPFLLMPVILAAVQLAAARPAAAALTGASSVLTRAPYLTDLTQASVQVSWATSTQTTGVVEYGPPGNCTAHSAIAASAGAPITVGSVTEYQNSVTVGGLAAATAYCYRVTSTGSAPVDLLGTDPSPQFATLEAPGGTSPLTFDVLGDWGDTSAATYATRTLPGGYTELWATAWVYVVSRSTSANLIGFRASTGGSIINLYLSQTGKLSLRNNAGGVTTTSATSMPAAQLASGCPARDHRRELRQRRCLAGRHARLRPDPDRPEPRRQPHHRPSARRQHRRPHLRHRLR